MKCILCPEEPETPRAHYCQWHSKAFEGMKEAFASWKNAYGDISLQDFLDRLINLPGTGLKAKEVAEFVRKDPGRWT